MSELLKRFKDEAQTLASEKIPSFYIQFDTVLHNAREMFFDHPLILRCQEDVLPFLNDGYGHGIEHSKKVAIEASAIVMAEKIGLDNRKIRHLALLAQLSGLLHDICRLDSDHACRGAEFSLVLLRDYPLSDHDKELITYAIKTHEAFTPVIPTSDPEKNILAGALYDADKFRWGPDNFGTTLWEICDYQEWSLKEILQRFPQGLTMMESIKPTFRTEIGRSFGPEFIEIGLGLGNTLYRRLKEFCSHMDCSQPDHTQ